MFTAKKAYFVCVCVFEMDLCVIGSSEVVSYSLSLTVVPEETCKDNSYINLHYITVRACLIPCAESSYIITGNVHHFLMLFL